MRKLLLVACVATLASGCYTVLRHPAVQDVEEPIDVTQANRCAACHTETDLAEMEWWFHRPLWYSIGWPVWSDPWSDPWSVSSGQPWWWAHPAPGNPRGTRHEAGASLANDRPPPPPPGNLAPQSPTQVPAGDQTPGAHQAPQQAPAGRQAQPAERPHPAQGESVRPASGQDRSAQPAERPHPASGTPKPNENPPAPSPAPSGGDKQPAPHDQGQGLGNDRGRPRP